MKLLGFDITLHVRKAPEPLPRSMVFAVVQLRGGDDYSVPEGTVGVVEDSSADGRAHFVAWASGGSSGPIRDDDLTLLGRVSVRLKPDA